MPRNSALRVLPPSPVDEIVLDQADLEELVARTQAIVHLTDRRKEYLEEAQRCEKMAVYLQESLTLWVARTYNLDIDHDQWHLDLDRRRLVRIPVEDV